MIAVLQSVPGGVGWSPGVLCECRLGPWLHRVKQHLRCVSRSSSIIITTNDPSSRAQYLDQIYPGCELMKRKHISQSNLPSFLAWNGARNTSPKRFDVTTPPQPVHRGIFPILHCSDSHSFRVFTSSARQSRQHASLVDRLE